MGLRAAAGTREVAAAVAAPEDGTPAQQAAGTAVVGREMAGGRWAVQGAEEERTAALARREAVGERTAGMAGKEAVGGRVVGMAGQEVVGGRVAGPLSCTCALPCPRPNPTLGQNPTAARWAAARVEVERKRRGSSHPSWVGWEARSEGRTVVMVVTAARAVTKAARALAAARAAARAVAVREAASPVAVTEVASPVAAMEAAATEVPVAAMEVAAMGRRAAMPAAGVGAREVVVMVEAWVVRAEDWVVRAEDWVVVGMWAAVKAGVARAGERAVAVRVEVRVEVRAAVARVVAARAVAVMVGVGAEVLAVVERAVVARAVAVAAEVGVGRSVAI